MRAQIPPVVLILLLTTAAPLHAAPPAKAAHVDPRAPCFRWPAVDMDRDGVFDRVDRCVSTPGGCVVDAYGCSTDGDRDGVCDGLDRCPSTPAGATVDEHGCSGTDRAVKQAPEENEPPREVSRPALRPQPVSRPASEVERQLVERGRIRLENVYFETNSAGLLPESEASLKEAGEALEKFRDLEIEIQGHTDTRGAAKHNLRLSQTRAESVRSWLLAHFRLEPANLTAKGYGETRPETRERNDEELLRNRRVELRVLNPEALPKGVEVEGKQ